MMSAKILVLNCGSSSIKYQLFAMPEGTVLARGLVERIGEERGCHKHWDSGGDTSAQLQVRDHRAGLEMIVKRLTTSQAGTAALKDLSDIAAVGHRVVHGGETFTGSVLITPEVVRTLEVHADLAPLHNPPNLAGIAAAKEFIPHAPQVGCFDTAFHMTLPEVAYQYALPRELYEKYHVRRYGFHGTSHRYVARRAAELLGKHKYAVNVITCHLGNGCSMAAVKEGKSVDTSMGLTPLEGLVMGTRCGDIDPAIIFYLAEKPEYKALKTLNSLLNKQSGLLGISGLSNDVRTLLQAAAKGHLRAALALDIFAYRIRKYIGAYAAVLPKLHAVVFTGGIGENAALLRAKAVAGLEHNLGIKLDAALNNVVSGAGRPEADIATADSSARILVIPTNEEKAIAADAYEIAVAQGHTD
ncbi:MAG: acetate kinase [Planctomycetota bacterium]|nr:acetate kinase [Planctomycetota bacterium]